MAWMMPWQDAMVASAVTGAGGLATLQAAAPRIRALGSFAREAALIIGLYGLWQLAGRLSVMGTDDAFLRAEAIMRAESWLPSIPSMQEIILWSSAVTQAANIYYAVMHFPATIALLVWLFLRHRDRYGQVRWVLAVTTFLCLMIQLVPVAPPRMMPGIVDTGIEFGQSVYGGGFGAGEYAAMPSVHVAWALAVGWYVWHIAESRWRWIGPAHAALTVLVVVVTGNHWWLDGIVAAAVLIASAAAVRAGYRLADRRAGRREPIDAGGGHRIHG